MDTENTELKMKMKIILIRKALGFLSSTSEAAKYGGIYFNTDSQDTQKKVDTLGTFIERKRKEELRQDTGLKCFLFILLGALYSL